MACSAAFRCRVAVLFGRGPKQGVLYCVLCLFYTYPSPVSACRFVMFQHCNKEEEKHDGLEAHISEQISASYGPLTINLVAVDLH
ncbi:hypothetical protein D5086_009948 [Populus alba]|uniref:Uncharacterized protein n=1 Tax=Populus alba TaxID=43335 RepID=A0ACC4C7Z7_POPAL